jgi:hypothetical protein
MEPSEELELPLRYSAGNRLDHPAYPARIDPWNNESERIIVVFINE